VDARHHDRKARYGAARSYKDYVRWKFVTPDETGKPYRKPSGSEREKNAFHGEWLDSPPMSAGKWILFSPLTTVIKKKQTLMTKP